MNALSRAIDRTTRQIDRAIGVRALFKSVKYGDLDLLTGTQSDLSTTCRVWIRERPISIRELTTLSQAGLTQIEKRWSLRAAYVTTVKPGDVITQGGRSYEVLSDPASSLDEFGIEWTIYTRRVRT